MTDVHGTVTVKVSVSNTGDASGKEVVEVYVGLPDGKLEKEQDVSVHLERPTFLHPVNLRS